MKSLLAKEKIFGYYIYRGNLRLRSIPMLELDLKNIYNFIGEDELNAKAKSAKKALDLLLDKKGVGSEFTGFISYPDGYDRNELEKIKLASKKISLQSEVLIVIGVGGSYLGSRAVIELLNSCFENENGTKIYFAGCNFSSDYAYELAEICRKKDFSVNVISKSGTTLEPAVAFRFFRKLLVEKYGEEGARDRIYCTTDKEKGTLRSIAEKEGWSTFSVPDDIGGRFSVLTSVGLLPIAVAGIDICSLIEGARSEMEDCLSGDFDRNPALRYAAARNLLLEKGKSIELLVSYEPSFTYMAEWWKQLFGESEGKQGKGLFPCSAIFSTDLHSFGQFVQDGSRTLFETVVCFKKSKHDFVVDFDEENSDGLNYLAGKSLQEINELSRLGALVAHVDGGVPNIVISLSEISPYELGKLIYFFETAVSVSGYMLGVNPFDQPGVENYKRNMFALLGRPGYEDIKAAIEAKI